MKTKAEEYLTNITLRTEVVELEATVQVAIGGLLVRQDNVAADTQASTLLGTPVGGLHDAGPPSGQHRITRLRQLPARLPSQLVVTVVLVETRRSEYGHRGSDVVEIPATGDEFVEHRDATVEIGQQVVGAPKQLRFRHDEVVAVVLVSHSFTS